MIAYTFLGESMKKIFLLVLIIIPIHIKAIQTGATSAILMDMDSHRILYSENIHKPRLIASITKIMTATLAVESGKMDDVVIVDNTIDKAYGSGIYITVGEKLTLRDLVYGLMLRSGNDAALMIAKYVGGSVSNFVDMMNNKATEIGMKNTIFNNPSGLDQEKGNYSTAYDMAILTSYAMRLKEYRKITKTKKYTLNTNKNSYVWHNKNKLLKRYKYATGGKTGFTKKAKRTLVTTASKDNMNLVVVTLNDGNDFLDHENLFEYGFNNYTSYNILKKGIIHIYDEDYYDDYSLYVKNNFNYLLSNDEKGSIILRFELVKKKHITNGDNIGRVIVKLGDKEVYEDIIYAKRKGEVKGLFRRLFNG